MTRRRLLLFCDAEEVLITNVNCGVEHLEMVCMISAERLYPLYKILSLLRSKVEELIFAVVHKRFDLGKHHAILHLVFSAPLDQSLLGHFLGLNLIEAFLIFDRTCLLSEAACIVFRSSYSCR